MTGDAGSSETLLANALASAGLNKRLRGSIFEGLREAETEAENALEFRDQVRWPLLEALLRDVGHHQVSLSNGLVFEVGTESRIERALLLSTSPHPDHVWEPQTTKLLVAIGKDVQNVIIGGAYIGDQALLIAQAISEGHSHGRVHAFEPDPAAFKRLLRHLQINSVLNVIPHQLGLWEKSNVILNIAGDAALALTSEAVQQDDPLVRIRSVSIDDYAATMQLQTVGLIMLDTEGAEEKGLVGANKLLSQPRPNAPHLVFEVHRNYVDWSYGLRNTSVVRYVMSRGYQVFAIRDFHDNYPMADKVIEIIPVDDVYLDGPPHGFNMLATKDPDLAARLSLKLVSNVSPKLLVDKNPALHHPSDGL